MKEILKASREVDFYKKSVATMIAEFFKEKRQDSIK
jgi:hypothetical protein